MMGKITLITFSLLVLCACSEIKNKEGNKIRFGVDNCFILDDGEKLISYQSEKKIIDSLYSGLQRCGTIQYPINRIIQAKDHYFIISISTENKLQRNLQAIDQCFSDYIIDQNDTENEYLFEKEGVFGVLKMLETEEFTIFIYYLSKNESLSKAVFDDINYFKNKTDCSF